MLSQSLSCGTRKKSLESQPISLFVSARKESSGKPLVNKSASCSLVSTLRTQISSPMNWRKKWYFIAICLVRTLIFVGLVANARAPLLSSQTRVRITDLLE